MKLAAFSIVYNEEKLIQGCINTWKPFVEKHIIMVSIKPFYGEYAEPDGTIDICRQNGVIVVQGHWAQEHKMRNVALSLLKGYDYVLVSDADMWMTPASVEEMLNEMGKEGGDAFIIPQKSYWFDTDHILVGDDFKPVIAVKPDVRFVHIGCVDRIPKVITSAVCHHLNWCRPKDILKKVKTYSHAVELEDVDAWYNNVFSKWNGGPAQMPRPIVRKTEEFGKVFQTKYDPLPEELKKWL